MAIDSRVIQDFILRILKVSIDIFCRFVQKHPIVSSVLLTLLVLYLFLPKVFLFLIYSSPFLACAAVYIRLYLPSKRSPIRKDVQDIKKKDQAVSSAIPESRAAADDHVVSRNGASVPQSETMSQRNIKERNRGDDSIGKAVLIEENPSGNGVSISSNVSVGEDIGDFSKASKSSIAALESVSRTVSVGESNGASSEASKSSITSLETVSRNVSIGESIGAVSELSKSSITSLDGMEQQPAKPEGGSCEAELENWSSDDEDEAKKVTNKAVEWTEDDQKNLMDLGISELERNKRLESLIARRRARKLCKMYTEKNLIHGNSGVQIPVSPVLVARDQFVDPPNVSDEKLPGSAPSVLLPTRNPFDLPYDPLEEKPDLTADSFQQEFMPPHQKEMFFCRHESFSLGPSFSLEGKHNDPDIAGNSRFTREQDKEDNGKVIDYLSKRDDRTLRRSLSITDLVTEEGESSKQGENPPENNGEADHMTRIEGKRLENTRGSYSSLSKGSEVAVGTNGVKHNRSESSFSSDDSESIIKPKENEVLSKILPPGFRFPDILSSPSSSLDPCPIPKARGANEVCYLASPATIDRSSLDNHLLYTNNGPWHTPNNSISSDMQVEVSEIGSPPSTGDGSASSNDEESLTYDGDTEKELNSGSDEMWAVSPHAPKAQQHDMTLREVNEFGREDITGSFSGFHKESEAPFASSSRSDTPEEITKDSINPDYKISNEAEQHEENLQKPQESLNPFEKSADEVEISYTVDVPDHKNDDLEIPKSVEDGHGLAETSTRSDVASDLSKPSEEINLESSKHMENHSIYSPVQSVEQVVLSFSTDDPVVHENVEEEDIESNKIDEFIEQEALVDLSNRTEEITSESDNRPANLSFLIPTQNGSEEQITREFEASAVKQFEESTSESVKYPGSISDNPPANLSFVPMQDASEEQSTREFEVSVVNHFEESTSESFKNPESSSDNPPASLSVMIPTQDAREEQSTREFEVSAVYHFKESTLESVKNSESSSDDPPTNLSFLIPTQDGREKQSTTEFDVSAVNHFEESTSEPVKNLESSSDNPPANLSFLIQTQDAREEQSTREFEAFAVNQNPNDSSTSGIQQEITIEEEPAISSASSSPKSVLPDRIPLAETSSDVNQNMQMGVSEYDMEKNIEKDKLLDEELLEHLVLTSNQNAQNVTEDLRNHPSIDTPQNSEATCDNTSEKSTDETRDISNVNECILDGGGTKEVLKSSETIHGESEASINNESDVRLLKTPDEINSKSVEKIQYTSRNLDEHEAKTDKLKPEPGHQDSNVPGVVVKEKVSENHSQEFKQDADENPGAEDLTEDRTATVPINPDVEGGHVDMLVNVEAQEQVILQNFMATEDAVANDRTNNDRTELVADGKHDLEQLDKKEVTSEQLNFIEDLTSGSMEDIKTGSINLTEDAVNNVQLQPEGESYKSNATKNIDNSDGDAQEGSNDSLKAVEGMKYSEGPIQDGTEMDKFTNNMIISEAEAPPLEDSDEHTKIP